MHQRRTFLHGGGDSMKYLPWLLLSCMAWGLLLSTMQWF